MMNKKEESLEYVEHDIGKVKYTAGELRKTHCYKGDAVFREKADNLFTLACELEKHFLSRVSNRQG